MTEMCSHGYTWGTCPHGCKPTTSAEEPIPMMEIPPEPYTDKLKCVICGTDVERGVVYKGKPLCGSCMKDLRGEKETPGTIGGLTEEQAKKFPKQGEE